MEKHAALFAFRVKLWCGAIVAVAMFLWLRPSFAPIGVTHILSKVLSWLFLAIVSEAGALAWYRLGKRIPHSSNGSTVFSACVNGCIFAFVTMSQVWPPISKMIPPVGEFTPFPLIAASLLIAGTVALTECRYFPIRSGESQDRNILVIVILALTTTVYAVFLSPLISLLPASTQQITNITLAALYVGTQWIWRKIGTDANPRSSEPASGQ